MRIYCTLRFRTRCVFGPLFLGRQKHKEGGALLNQLTPLVYEELRRLARRYMRNERVGNTLQTTALVNEAYLRLVDAKSVGWQDRVHFFAVR
jgi:hypothetical protein